MQNGRCDTPVTVISRRASGHPRQCGLSPKSPVPRAVVELLTHSDNAGACLPSYPIADPIGSADKEQPDLVLYTKVDHLAGRFMSLVTNTSFYSSALLVLRSLQFLPRVGERILKREEFFA